MPVEFDPLSRDDQPEEVVPAPAAHRRRWIIAASAGVAVALVGGAIALAQVSASATTATTPAAAATATASPSPRPHAPTGRPFTPRAIKPSMLGTVKSVSGTKILITDFQGFIRTIITSSKTVYKDGLTASPKVGTKLEAEGTVDKDGTSLDATVVQSLRGPFGGSGGMHPGGGGFPGGPRAFGTPGVRPTGAPTGNWPSGFPTGHHPGPNVPIGTPAINVNS